MQSNRILDLIAQGEHTGQDFKLRIDSSKKIAITLSAFANTEGGCLLIGVKDNGKISGVRSSEEEFHMVNAAAEMYCNPPIKIIPELVKTGGKEVLIVEIPKNPEPVLALNPNEQWRAYLRFGDENFMANRVVLLSMKLSFEKSKPFELSPEHYTFLNEAAKREAFGFHFAQRKLRCNPRKTEYNLAQFIRWGILGYHLSGSKTNYFVRMIPDIADASH